MAADADSSSSKGKGEERKVIRAHDGCGSGYGGSDPQGMPLTGKAMPPGASARSGHFLPRVWNERNQAAVQKARVYLN
jgi:hypothetical protein